jgi:hypothetical protein
LVPRFGWHRIGCGVESAGQSITSPPHGCDCGLWTAVLSAILDEEGEESEERSEVNAMREVADAARTERRPPMPGQEAWGPNAPPRLTAEQFAWTLSRAWGAGKGTDWVPIAKFVETAGACMEGRGGDFVLRGAFRRHFKSRFGVNVKGKEKFGNDPAHAAGFHIKRVDVGKSPPGSGPWAMRLTKLKGLYGPPH